MKLRQRLLIAGGLVLLLGLAYFLRDAIYEVVIIPIAYIGYLLHYYYSLIPQLFVWTILLVILFGAAMINFIPDELSIRRTESRRRANHSPVETLAMAMARAGKGTYFKWQIANRLGGIQRGLQALSGEAKPVEPINERAEKYLYAGLNTSFVDYHPRTDPYQPYRPTPLDLDPQEVVEYLEKQMETHLDRHK